MTHLCYGDAPGAGQLRLGQGLAGHTEEPQDRQRRFAEVRVAGSPAMQEREVVLVQGVRHRLHVGPGDGILLRQRVEHALGDQEVAPGSLDDVAQELVRSDPGGKAP